LERFEIEAAFVSEPFELKGLSSVAAFEEELVLITARGTPALRSAAELNGRTILAFPHGCSYRRCLVDWLTESGASPGRIMDLASYYAIVACVAAGTGAAIVPAEVLDHVTLGAAVMRHPLPDRLRVNRTHLVWSGEATAPLQALTALLPEPHAQAIP
jgi:DNA-binding transcriptional LysR family regulator